MEALRHGTLACGFLQYFFLLAAQLDACQVYHYDNARNPPGVGAHDLGYLRARCGKGNTIFHGAYAHGGEHARGQRCRQEVGGRECFALPVIVHGRIRRDG